MEDLFSETLEPSCAPATAEGRERQDRLRWTQCKRGLHLLVLLTCSWSVESMDAQQFTQLMAAFDSMLTRQNVVAEGTAQLMARLPEMISASSSSSSSNLARNLESASRVLKTPKLGCLETYIFELALYSKKSSLLRVFVKSRN